MSSKIGDYIHLTARNYNKMGTGSPFQGGNVDNSNPTQVFRSVRQKISQDFSSKVSEKNNYTDLEIAINKLMKGNQAEDIQLDAMWDAIVNEMTKEFGRRLGDIERSFDLYYHPPL